MIALVEGAERQKTPNEIALNILLAGLTIIFLLAVVTLQPFAIYSGAPQSLFVLVSLLVCLIPTTIGGLLSAIGIAGMDRLVQRNVLAMSGRAVEAAGDVHTLLLDKTGTITFGNRQATEFMACAGRSAGGRRRRRAAVVARGRNARRAVDRRAGEGAVRIRGRELAEHEASFVPFTAQTRMSGVDLDGRRIRKGAADAIERYVQEHGGTFPPELRQQSTASRAPAARRWSSPSDNAAARRRPPEGHRQGRHPRTVRGAARDGHQDRDDHRRQPADRRVDRGRGRRGRLPGPGDAGRQDGADQEGADRTASSSR